MSNVIGDAVIKLRIDESGIQKGLTSAGNKIKSIGGTAIKTWATLTTTVVGATVSSAMTLVGAHLDDAMKRMDTLNNFPKVMESLGYSANEADKSISEMDKHLDGLPTTLDQSVSDIQKLTATMGNLSKGTVNATSLGLGLNDMFLAGGKGTEVASRAMEQYNQMLAIGKVDMQSWRSLVDASPGQMNQLAQSLLGAEANAMDLYNAMKNGTVTFEDLNAEIVKLDKEGGAGFESFYNQAVANTQGLETQIQNIKTSITKVVTDALQGNMEALAGHTEQLTERVLKVAPTLIEGATVAVGALLEVFPQVFREILPEVLGSLKELGKSVVEFIPEIAVLVAEAIPQLIDGLFDLLSEVIESLTPKLPEILEKLVVAFVDIFKTLYSPKNIKIVIKSLVQVAIALAKAIPQIIPPIVEALPEIISGIFQAIAELAVEAFNGLMTAIAQPMANIGQWLIDHVFTPVGAFFQMLFDFVKGVFSTAVEWFNGTIIMPIVGFVMGGIEKIKLVVAGVVDWVNVTIITPIASFFTGLWDTLVNGVSSAIEQIKAVWEGIKNWINAFIVMPIAGFFGKLWSGVKKGAESLGDGIGKVMSTIGGLVKAPINSIIDAINGVIDSINSLTVPDWVPGIGGSHTNFGHIPRLAQGGLVSGATNAIIGEAGAEAVIPLERNTENWTRPLATALAEQFQAQGIGGAGMTIYMTNNINNNLDADEIGQRLITSIRRAS